MFADFAFCLFHDIGRLPHRGESFMSMNGSPLANVRPSLAVYLPDPGHGVEQAIISVPQANGQVSEALELVLILSLILHYCFSLFSLPSIHYTSFVVHY